MTTQRIAWLMCCNALLFTFLDHWLQPPSLSIKSGHLLTLQTFINLQWMMIACLTGIPFFYLLFRSINKPDWCRLYLKNVKALIVSGPGTLYKVTWLGLIVGIMYCLISARNNALFFTEYSMPWLLLVMLWGVVFIDYSLIAPLWVIMLILLNLFTNNYMSSPVSDAAYLHHQAISTTMIFIFSFTIVVIGVLVVRNKHYLQRLMQLSRSESNTGLPNLRALKMDMNLYSAHCLCYLRYTELNSLERVHGIEFRFAFVNALCGYVGSLLRDSEGIYFAPGQGIIIRLNSLPVMSDFYHSLNAFRFHWKDFELGLSCGLAYTNDTALLRNLTQALKLLNTQSLLSQKMGQPLQISQQSSGDNIFNEAVIRHVLQKAIDCQSFVLMAQPILSTNRQARYHEILVRIKILDGKMIFPDTILPVAKEAELLPALDITVIEQTFRFMHLSHYSDPNSHFSINLTPDSLNNTGFIDNVLMLFRKYNIRPERIIFEIIESEIIDNAIVVEALKALRRVGSKIAIDDFGTGSSSFSRLRMLEADILKIDGSFIRNILNDEFSRYSVRSFCEVAKFKSMEVVAEFVDNEEVENMLIEMGIGWLQGYHIGKPVPVETLVSEIQSAAKMARPSLQLEAEVV
ncbi:EAL domain-containing protein [Citrobacter portucalensis]|uniref:EAL domain-containing protein n=1 Tax=Citrobacter portucalensis TaxID=1639133 RepID=UPI003CEF5FF3